MLTLTTDFTPATWRQSLMLYHQAFPAVERLNPKWLRYRTRTPQAEWLQVIVDQKWAGFAYVLVSAKLVYVLYLAVSPAMRGRGVGAEILRQLQQRYAHQVVTLSAERPQQLNAPNPEQRQARQKFYSKNGFKLAGFYTREKGGVEYDFYCSAAGQRSPQWLQQQFLTLVHRWAKRRGKYYLPITLHASAN